MVPVLDERGERVPTFASVTVAYDGAGGGPAIVRALGVDPRDDQVEVAVDYLLEPGARYARIVRSVHNRGRGHYRQLFNGHLVLWGELSPFAPGVGTDLVGQRTRTDWLGADGLRGSVVMAAGTGLLTAVHGRDWSVVGAAPAYLEPGASVVTETQLFASPDAGVAGAVDALFADRKVVSGTVVGRVIQRGGALVPGAWIMVRDAQGAPVNRARTNAAGLFRLDARPGTYTVAPSGPGRLPGEAVRFSLGADDEDRVALVLEPPSAVAVRVVDEAGVPVPARLRLEGQGGTPTPTLGPLGGAPGAGHELLAVRGRVTHLLAPGRYRAHVHAGPRFGVVDVDFEVAVGRTVSVRVTLQRQMAAEGWTLLDPHVHTKASPTSSTPLAARIAACAAAGVEALVVVDEARVTPVVPTTRPPFVFSGVGLAAPEEGRFAALPVSPGAPPDPQGGRAIDALRALRALPEAPQVAVLWPRSSGWGYFAHFGFDPESPTLPRGGFDLDFDLFEVAVPGDPAAVEAAFADFRGLVDRGRRVVPIGGSGADVVAGQPCGLPGTWVRGSLGPDPDALRARLAAGDVVVGFGPLIDLEIDGARPGGTIESAPWLVGRARVMAPAWARPSELRLWLDGEVVQTVHLRPGTGPLDVTHAFRFKGAGARWLLAEVDGPRDLASATGVAGRPFAITAPIRIGAEAAPTE